MGKKVVSISLPFVPPPLSKLTTNVPGRGRVRTKEYKAWIRSCIGGQILGLQGGPRTLIRQARPLFTGEIGVRYMLKRPNTNRMDICNREKAISDLLGGGKNGVNVFIDDSYISQIEMTWMNELGSDADPFEVFINIWDYNG